jgi:LPXTG-motif cell wall-anchored protein
VVDAVDGRPVPEAVVVLRVAIDQQFVPAEETTADARGRFRFEDLPVGRQFLYVPGANADGIHYPGPRVRLSPFNPDAEVRVEVCRAVEGPNPLVVRHHEIVLEPEGASLRVSETLRIENPTQTCYVGHAEADNPEPVTLRLSMPPDVERTTFEREFYGRRFSVAEGGLVTSIPWTPGERELKYTYVLPFDARLPVWERPLDLPTEDLVVTVRTDKPDEVDCNLQRSAPDQPGEIIFRSGADPLAAGEVVRVELAGVPFSWRAHGPWLALATLAALIGGAGLVILRRRKRNQPTSAGRPRDCVEGRHVGKPYGCNRRSQKRRRRNATSRSGT